METGTFGSISYFAQDFILSDAAIILSDLSNIMSLECVGGLVIKSDNANINLQ